MLSSPQVVEIAMRLDGMLEAERQLRLRAEEEAQS